MTISGEDSQLDVLDEAYLCARKLGISDRLIVFLACTFVDDIFRFLVLLSPYGGLGAGFIWFIDQAFTLPINFLLRNWSPGG